MSTIVALSSGRPPAAIAVLRISGPEALAAAAALAGRLPSPRRAALRSLRDADGALLDRALVLVFPGPHSATGEDLVECHCHGGRATVAAVIAALLAQSGVREAEPGEFTRRALINGRIDLAQAEGLADLLEAETETQRRLALSASEGRVSDAIRGWMDRLTMMSAEVEAALDFAEDGDVAVDLRGIVTRAAALRDEIAAVLAAPPVERIRDGLRVVIAGPPNAGKSTLLNLLAQADAAIVSPIAGTTRDRVEVPVQRGGVAYRLIDTAGLTGTDDPIERIGVTRAIEAASAADLVLWLGDDLPPQPAALWLHPRADLPGRTTLPANRLLAIRQDDPDSIEAVWRLIANQEQKMRPGIDVLFLRRQQRLACREAAAALDLDTDPLIAAEQLRTARSALAAILGVDATETMLDALFGRFCLGK